MYDLRGMAEDYLAGRMWLVHIGFLCGGMAAFLGNLWYADAIEMLPWLPHFLALTAVFLLTHRWAHGFGKRVQSIAVDQSHAEPDKISALVTARIRYTERREVLFALHAGLLWMSLDGELIWIITMASLLATIPFYGPNLGRDTREESGATDAGALLYGVAGTFYLILIAGVTDQKYKDGEPLVAIPIIVAVTCLLINIYTRIQNMHTESEILDHLPPQPPSRVQVVLPDPGTGPL